MMIPLVGGSVGNSFQDGLTETAGREQAGRNIDAREFVPGQSQHCYRMPDDAAKANMQAQKPVLPLCSGGVVGSFQGASSTKTEALRDLQKKNASRGAGDAGTANKKKQKTRRSKVTKSTRGSAGSVLGSSQCRQDDANDMRIHAMRRFACGSHVRAVQRRRSLDKVSQAASSNADFGVPEVQARYAFAQCCPSCRKVCCMVMHGATPASLCVACGKFAPAIPVEWAVSHGDGTWTKYTSLEDARQHRLLAIRKRDGLLGQKIVEGARDDAVQYRTQTTSDPDSPWRRNSSVEGVVDGAVQDQVQTASDLESSGFSSNSLKGAVDDAVHKHRTQAALTSQVPQTEGAQVGPHEVPILSKHPLATGRLRWCDIDVDES